MPDMTCPQCGEPSDTWHVRHDMTAPLPSYTLPIVGWDGDPAAVWAETTALPLLPDGMPDTLRTLTIAAIRAEAALESILQHPARPIPDSVWDPAEQAAATANEAWRAAMYRVGLAHGCDCCLLDPDRRTGDLDYLRRALFDSTWDGDPAELYGF